jgi:hypothetical protein
MGLVVLIPGGFWLCSMIFGAEPRLAGEPKRSSAIALFLKEWFPPVAPLCYIIRRQRNPSMAAHQVYPSPVPRADLMRDGESILNRLRRLAVAFQDASGAERRILIRQLAVLQAEFAAWERMVHHESDAVN